MSETKTKTQFDGKYIAKLAITLLAITAVAALLLSIVYSVTKPTIDARAEQTRNQSMSQVMAGATEFTEVQYTPTEGVTGVNAAYNGTELMGYCVQVGPSGFGKTTFCNLVARFWAVECGRASIGGSERLPLRGHHRK